MRNHLFAAAVSAAVIATSACALAFTAPSTAPDSAPSGTYTIDPSHTNVLFGLSHMGFSKYYGRFNTIAGELTFDAKNPTKSSVNVTIDVASIDTNNAELEGKLKSADWFDATKYPTATFVSSSVEKTTATTGVINGTLTLHGISKPTKLAVTFNGAGVNPFSQKPMLGFSAAAIIKRSDFGLTEYIPMVGDEVTLTIETEMQKK